MILNELFDTAARYQLTDDGTGYFNINGKAFVVDFAVEPDKSVEVSFMLRDGEYKGGTPKYTHTATGTGDELVVFSTVIAIIREYLKRTPTHKIVFTSKTSEPSRVKLYDRMARTLVPGWQLSTRFISGEKMYELVDPAFHTRNTPPGAGSSEDVPF
jgi:hypothetical protein